MVSGYHRVWAMRLSVVTLLLVLGFVFGVSCAGTRTAGQVSTEITHFSGGTFEASGVAHVPGTDAVLFVDDDRVDAVFWMRLDERGAQVGPIEPIKLGVSVIDLEGMTFDGTYFYIIGSQSKSQGGDLTGLVRFKFDALQQRVETPQSVSGLKSFLALNVKELRGMENTSYENGGINIEGLAWDPNGKRLLLGLRSPVVAGSAVIVPLRLRDSGGALSAQNLEVDGEVIKLPCGGAGIRSIEYDERVRAFRVITGAGPDAEKMDFKLWEWDGERDRPGLRELITYDRRLKPEGITRVSMQNRDFGFIVFDTSGYVIAK